LGSRGFVMTEQVVHRIRAGIAIELGEILCELAPQARRQIVT
jgi:hypothetical protein